MSSRYSSLRSTVKKVGIGSPGSVTKMITVKRKLVHGMKMTDPSVETYKSCMNFLKKIAKMHTLAENLTETILTLEQRIDLALLDSLFEPLQLLRQLDAIIHNDEQLMNLLDSYNIPRKV